MSAVGRGDRSARETIVRRLEPRIRRLSRALAAGSADWEDAAQHAILEVLKSAATYDGKSAVERWADRITVRTTLRHLKSERERQRNVDGERSVDDVAGEASPQTFSTSEMNELLRRLSEPKRTALVLHHVAGYSIDEVAALTDVPVNTAKDRLLAARREMRSMIRRTDVAYLRLVGGDP